MSKIRLASLTLLGLIGVHLLSLAGDHQMQAGLWEMSSTLRKAGSAGAAPKQTFKHCYNQAAVDSRDISSIVNFSPKSLCQVTQQKKVANKVIYKMSCQAQGNPKIKGEIVLDAEHFDNKSQLEINNTAGGKVNLEQTVVGRRIGECPT